MYCMLQLYSNFTSMFCLQSTLYIPTSPQPSNLPPGERKTPVFFVGGFLAENRRAWEIISRSFRNLECGPALFLRHADFLGALGCLGATIEGKGDMWATHWGAGEAMAEFSRSISKCVVRWMEREPLLTLLGEKKRTRGDSPTDLDHTPDDSWWHES